jgi:hypoxanthine phosphoribosyltransferase
MNKVYLTWDDMDELVSKLANQIKSSELPQYITGLPRGGLIPAVMLSHKLNIPFISSIDVYSFPKLHVLVVDDIADSGETLKQYSDGCRTAVLHYKPQSIHKPTFYAAKIDDIDWIVYPFEREDSETIQDYLK